MNVNIIALAKLAAHKRASEMDAAASAAPKMPKPSMSGSTLSAGMSPGLPKITAPKPSSNPIRPQTSPQMGNMSKAVGGAASGINASSGRATPYFDTDPYSKMLTTEGNGTGGMMSAGGRMPTKEPPAPAPNAKSAPPPAQAAAQAAAQNQAAQQSGQPAGQEQSSEWYWPKALVRGFGIPYIASKALGMVPGGANVLSKIPALAAAVPGMPGGTMASGLIPKWMGGGGMAKPTWGGAAAGVLPALGGMTVLNGLMDGVNGLTGGWNDNGAWAQSTTPGQPGGPSYAGAAFNAWGTPIRSATNIATGINDIRKANNNSVARQESMARTGSAQGKFKTFETLAGYDPSFTPARTKIRAQELAREHPELAQQLAPYLK